jgi:O-antigen ligase
MASLLLLTIPFLAAMVASARGSSKQRYSAILVLAAGLGILIVVGIALNGSLAGYGLAVPVIAASLLVILRARRLRLWVVALEAVLLIGAVSALQLTPIGSTNLGDRASGSVQSRAEIVAVTSRAAGDFMPYGSGLGSFRQVYRLFERPEQVTNTYVIHAHNDYAEVVLELGLGGIILILVGFAWWCAAVWRAWSSAEARPFARAAAIASAAVLTHSLVDFPLRTAAIAASFAMCLALLAHSRPAPRKEPAELRRSRHVVI